MSDDSKDKKPEPVYAPTEQSLLPGYKKFVSQPPKDWRKWEDGHGNKIDAPKYQGAQFTGRIVPPLTDSHGNPIKKGDLQIVKDSKGNYKIIDWSLSAIAEPTSKSDTERDVDSDFEDARGTAPIMGRTIYETRHSLDRAYKALDILAHEQKDRLGGKAKDPAACFDLKGVRIAVGEGKIWLGQYVRGKFAGQYVLVDDRVDITLPGHLFIFNKKTESLKEAVAKFLAEVANRKVAPKKKQYTWPQIQFSAPEGFGSFGGAGYANQTYPTPDSLSWDTIVELYARTGRWCETAMLIWSDQQYPEELIEQCRAYREEYLANPAAFYEPWESHPHGCSEAAPKGDSDLEESKAILDREIAESHEAVRDVLEAFDGATLLSFEPRTSSD